MPLVNAKCTNCGANLQVDNTKDAAICQYCGSAYIVEKAINNYNTVNHINANVVNIYGGNSVDFVIRAGVLEKYNGASPHVVIPNSVSHIGNRAFKDCYGLNAITIPDSVVSIGVEAFYQCKSLETIIIPSSVKEILHRAFACCEKLKAVNIPYGITCIHEGAFSWCKNLKHVTFPDSVVSIDKDAFSRCDGLEKVVIPNSVTKIGEYAFSDCKGLKNVSIPDSVTFIGTKAFFNCVSLQSISLPKQLTMLGQYAFADCTSLSSVIIPNAKVLRYARDDSGDCVFQRCWSLTNVMIQCDDINVLTDNFNGTPWLEQKREQHNRERDEIRQKNRWQQAGVCDHCGGSFKGLFEKKCIRCGKSKQY